MPLSIEDREKNLFNATDTLAQFYDEIESFTDILSGKMEKKGYPSSEERPKVGYVWHSQSTCRLLASAMVMFVKDTDDAAEDDEPDEEPENEGVEAAKVGKKELTITRDLKIPFVSLFLFTPKTIPSVQTLESPQLLLVAAGTCASLRRGRGSRATWSRPRWHSVISCRFPSLPTAKSGMLSALTARRLKAMRKYNLEATLIGFESHRLLELDTEEKIGEIADKLAAFCQQ